MAALSIAHSFLTVKSSNQKLKGKNCSTFLVRLACQSHEPVHESSTTKTKTKTEEKESRNLQMFSQLLIGVEKFGKGLKENMSPRQKGDWKDLVLMSLSFAVYVYISEMIVCAYFAWTTMPKQSW